MNFQFTSLLLFAFVTTISALNKIPNFLEKPPEGGKIWAVLAAGSFNWHNYRHQANLCHSYHVLKKHGIPDERIIVMMTDDIAYHKDNPTPGVIINHPKGKNVYKGVPKDYTGDAVTVENFMAILKGDKKSLDGKGSGKILESGPNDHLFVYFADHGTTGGILFPNNVLSARDLNQTIHYMYENKKYGKMVIYVDACHSGSMFEHVLPNNINVYATTSARGDESSFACYFDELRKTYLGDHYSVNWMEDSDKEVLTNETLHQQYDLVKKETTRSHVLEFGDLTISQLHVSEFQGRKVSKPIILPKDEMDLVRSHDVPIEIVKRILLKSDTLHEEQQLSLLKKLHKMLKNRQFLSQKVSEIVSKIYSDKMDQTDVMENHYKLKNFECYDEVRTFFNDECFSLPKNEHALDFMHVLVNICEKGVSSYRIMNAMEEVCIHPPMYGIV